MQHNPGSIKDPFQNISGLRNCSHKRERCERNICQTEDEIINTKYPCYIVHAVRTSENGSAVQSVVFMSYAKAKQTKYQCIMHECKRPSIISEYVHELEEKHKLECYYHPDKKELVYLQTGNWNQILTEFVIVLIFTVIGGLFDIFVGFLFTLGFLTFLCWVAASACDSCCHSKCRDRLQEIILPYKDNIGLHLMLSMNCLNYRQRKKEFAKAIESGDSCVVKRIYAKNYELINEEIRDELGVTYPLNIAIRRGDFKLSEFLLLNGAKTSVQISEYGRDRTLLHLACEMGKTDLIKLLIKHGCLGYTGRNANQSIILIILQKGYIDCLKILILAGYPIHKEIDLITSYLTNNSNNPVYSYMIDRLENPLSLQELCRITVRLSVGDYRLLERLEMLGLSNGGCLPQIMVRYLKLETFDGENRILLNKDSADSSV